MDSHSGPSPPTPNAPAESGSASIPTATMGSLDQKPPPRYEDPEYQAAHDDLFEYLLDPNIESILPPGVTPDDFAQALDEFVEAVGFDAVVTGNSLREYIDPYDIPESGQRTVPSAAVCPSSVEQIQAVLKVANKYLIPVWTFSAGKNLGYGGPAPVVSGSVALDLHRMNKIIEVNDTLSYAVVEPGVTFAQLYAYCAKHKLKVWPSTPSLGWGSVIGNTLERGLGFLPNGSHHSHIAGLEALLGDADIVRTGQFAKIDSQTSHLTPLSYGPSLDGLFLQSNLGIVTKLGLHMTPQPQAYTHVIFDVPDMGDVAKVAELFADLKRRGVINGMLFVVSVIEMSSIFGRKADWWDGTGPIPEEKVREIQEKLDIGFWNVKFGLYGAPGVVDAQLEEIKRVVARDMPKGRLRSFPFRADGDDAGGEKGRDKLVDAAAVPPEFGGMFVGIPSMFSLPLVKYYNKRTASAEMNGGTGDGIGAHGAYSAVLPVDGIVIAEWAAAAKQIYEKHGMDFMSDFFLFERHALFVCMLCFDKTSLKQREATDRIYEELFREGSRRGFAKYRAHIRHMDEVAELYDFNDHAHRRTVERIKDAMDPNGILSPGKMGIWPMRFRELREKQQKSEPGFAARGPRLYPVPRLDK